MRGARAKFIRKVASHNGLSYRRLKFAWKCLHRLYFTDIEVKELRL